MAALAGTARVVLPTCVRTCSLPFPARNQQLSTVDRYRGRVPLCGNEIIRTLRVGGVHVEHCSRRLRWPAAVGLQASAAPRARELPALLMRDECGARLSPANVDEIGRAHV